MPVEGIKSTATYLTFTLGEEVFAVDVQEVREVLDFTSITKVPRTPDFMRGVINLRGSVVPVIDMRLKFGMEGTEETVDTCVIVMEVNLDGETAVIGALADSVKEVFDLDPEQIEPPPRIGTSLNTEFIHGMGKHNDLFIIILDINRVFSADELTLVGAAGMLSSEAGEGGAEASAGDTGRQEQQA
jgi:purine-binding chemotaxis protein CheW